MVRLRKFWLFLNQDFEEMNPKLAADISLFFLVAVIPLGVMFMIVALLIATHQTF